MINLAEFQRDDYLPNFSRASMANMCKVVAIEISRRTNVDELTARKRNLESEHGYRCR